MYSISRIKQVIEMLQLKELLLPSEATLDFSTVKTRSKFHDLKWKILVFLILFALIMVVYILVTSLTYKQVSSENNPAYNVNITLYFVLNSLAPSMIQQGMLASVALNKAVFLNSYSYITNCGNISLIQDSYVYAPTTNDPFDIGCFLNLTVSYSMEYAQQGQYYLISLNGFSFNPNIYSQIKGDLVLKTTGIIGDTFTTTPVFQILSGINGQNVMISSLSNSFTYMTFDLKNIVLFGLSSFTLLWKVVNIFFGIILSKIKKEVRYSQLVNTQDGMYIEV